MKVVQGGKMIAMLLRIGIDKGKDSGGALAPIFEDGSFEFIPIPENKKSKETQTYGNTIGRHGKPFSYYIPEKIKDRKMHFDPEFVTFTYGDPTSKRNFLLKMGKDDLLVFYAGLSPYQNNNYENSLYIIGYFLIDKVIDFNKSAPEEIENYRNTFLNNAHSKREDTTNVVIVVGNKNRSRLLDKAIKISQRKTDKIGRPTHALSEEMERLLGRPRFIQRSVPPMIIDNQENITNLRRILNIT